MRSLQQTLVWLSFLAVAGSGAALAQEPSHSDSVIVETDVMVRMRDGVQLATDVYRRARGGQALAGPLPTLLQRTPYSKSGDGLVDQARAFAAHGYVVVLQDTRGRYKSEGEFEKYYRYDALDGYDTIGWIVDLPYTTDKVGTWGTSYGAHTQADAAKTNPFGLAAMLLNFGGLSNGWDHKVRNHGALELGQQLGWAFGELPADAGDPVIEKRFEMEEVSDWFAAIPFRKGLNPLSARTNFEDYFIEQQNHGDYDEFWMGYGLNWERYYERTADAAMMHVGGWYDPYAGTTTQNFAGLSALKSAPQHMIMGPWTHGGNTRTYAGDVEFGPEAAIPDFSGDFHLRWFDHHLKGVPNEAAALPPVKVFVMGTGDGHKDTNGRLFHGGYWRSAVSWPPPEARPARFYFHPDGSLQQQPPTVQESATTYTYDPTHPVPTVGGSFSGVLKRGAYDQREREFKSLSGGSENGFYGSRPPYLPLSTRQDVVVFQTAPLEQDVEIIGPVRVHVYVSSSAVDTDFTAKLLDVYPPSADYPAGFDMNLTDGIVRARYRSFRDHQELMTPGRVYELTIEPFPTANVFKQGHRIRVDISSSNFPRFDVNPNTGDPLGQHRRMVPADNTIHHDATRASYVELSLMPASR